MIAAPKRVAITGMYPRQFAHVQRSIPPNVALHIIDREHINWPGADLVIVMTKFVSHSHIEKCIATYGRERVVLCHGGLSSLKRLLVERGGQ